MTLQVPFEDYPAAAKRFEIGEAYLLIEHEQLRVTGCNPKSDVTLVCQTSSSEAVVRVALEKQGLAVFRGVWSENLCALEDNHQGWYVAAVSYKSGEHVPGVWVDAFKDEPNHVHVLQALYEEFRQTGEMPDVTIEDFIRNANPNVVVVSDTQLKGFIDAKQAANPVPR